MVIPGSIAVLSAYGMGAKLAPAENEPTNVMTKAIVQKMAFDGGGIFSNDCNCSSIEDIPLSLEPDFSFVEDVIQCGLWNLNACQNVGVIILPGTYRLRLDDSAAPGHIYVSLTLYRKDEAGQLPSGLIFGE